MRYAFNGYLFSQRQTGVMRYAKEILQELDRICQKDEFVLVVPQYADKVPQLRNIKIEIYGNTKGILWEQYDFVRYLKNYNMESVNFNNSMPLTKPGIIVIHDIAYKIHPEFCSSLYGKISKIYHRVVFRLAASTDKPIVTVSYYSKYQIIDEYDIAPNRIHVIGNAWQHMNRVDYDDSVIDKYDLKKKEYFFSLGSLSKSKNTNWIIDVANKNPQYTFVVSGAKSNSSSEEYLMPQNVIETGYITDEQVKSLIRDCRAFIYPSIYDGFGIPPIEALSIGADVICSNAACLTEIYRNSVHYIDPYDTDVNIEEILNEKVSGSRDVLDRYSWEKSAMEFYRLLGGK